ncbi:bifunctional diaminohydroxyphosphoribosylaminopyrimidine deaminase/5-amino-6-(5-phosphoribosylamino)uracil reductase RibD [Chloroflexi bacterium]|nr:bifunctional diaminohydroxyphosphoribosylaminopyrimidine deaminase/5-amino-6-(5-phosphoribosylamino)uracil reductase RibD [Chloroflexota bacterium]
MSYMGMAIAAGKKAKGISNPNPPVGAIVVKDEKVLSEGFTGKPGSPHAEVMAISSAGDNVKNSTLYVTLEPCCHFGRTPPCTEAIIQSGISKIFIAVEDPDNRVSGKGIDQLRKAGIEVVLGIGKEETELDLEAHIKLATTGLPLVTAKFAMSLDGKIATSSGESKWITSDESRNISHVMRLESDAIMVGVNTVVVDDPRLTVRLDRREVGRQPLRVIIDSQGRIPNNSSMLLEEGATFVATAKDVTFLDGINNLSTKAFPDKEGKVDLVSVLEYLGKMPVSSVFVEGGSELLGSLFDQGLVDKVAAFISPSIIGGRASLGAVGGIGAEFMSDKYLLTRVKKEFIGSDILVTGYCERGV